MTLYFWNVYLMYTCALYTAQQGATSLKNTFQGIACHQIFKLIDTSKN